ncbi:hypothetical protein N7470_003772 [Penicillium chermesinum]|nr:hypothetical protein N7470_003772 [Penicillium chermesinum]
MSELRQRPNAIGSGSSQSQETPARGQKVHADENRGISVLDIIRVLVTLVLAILGLSYYTTNGESFLWGYRPWFTRLPVVMNYLLSPPLSQTGPVNLTPAQLSLYNGSDKNLPIYLAVNGSIFDVSANPRMYGPGGAYGFFSGRDATRAFVTGCFKEDLTPDLVGVEQMFLPIEDVEGENLSSAQKKVRREREMRLARAQVDGAVARWENFFRNHGKYFQVGRIVDYESYKKDDPQVGKRVLCESAEKQRPKRSETGHL